MAKWRLANCLTDRAEALAKLGRLPESLAQHREALSILEAAAASDEGNTQMQMMLARSSQRYADALAAAGRFAEARAAYERAIGINQPLADEDPANMDVRWALADDYLKLARLLRNPNGNIAPPEDGARYFELARRICVQMRNAGLNIKPVNDRLGALDRELGGV